MPTISSSYLHIVFPEERKEVYTSNIHNLLLYEDLNTQLSLSQIVNVL